MAKNKGWRISVLREPKGMNMGMRAWRTVPRMSAGSRQSYMASSIKQLRACGPWPAT
jgi:hypothetical protein